jgi:polysaccharide export outer membrane protein
MKFLPALLLSFAWFASSLTAQLTPEQFPGADPSVVSPLLNVTPQQQQPMSLPAQKIGPGDLIAISVSDCPDLTRSFRVAFDGTLPLPFLKERILAAGKEPPEIEAEIASALVRDEILVHPIVSAAVMEYRSVPVSVVGAVKHAITFQAIGKVTLLDALARADGLTTDAGGEIIISHPAPAGSLQAGLLQRISVKSLYDEADPVQNIRLQGGEEIRVPAAGKVWVVGNVKKPGSFPIREANDVSIMTVVAQSEGFLPYTNKMAFIYRREAGKDQRNEIPVELARIMKRQAPDVQLQANDILYIPDSTGRRVTAQTIERIIGFGTATGTGVLVFH